MVSSMTTWYDMLLWKSLNSQKWHQPNVSAGLMIIIVNVCDNSLFLSFFHYTAYCCYTVKAFWSHVNGKLTNDPLCFYKQWHCSWLSLYCGMMFWCGIIPHHITCYWLIVCFVPSVNKSISSRGDSGSCYYHSIGFLHTNMSW